MPAVTIGVPVYNGGADLDECLECLANQTFSDLEVLIYDNASTDRTASIAQHWAARDARFRYFRQSETRDALRNFSDVLNAATSEYFMWRAHDDLSAPNFVEVAHRLISSISRAKLAVGSVRRLAVDGSPKPESRVPNLDNGPRLFRIRRALLNYHPSWFYGLWKRQAALDSFNIVRQGNPYVWGFDHLTLVLLATSDSIVGSNETYFVQRKRKANPPPPGIQVGQLYADFAEQCRQMVDRQPMRGLERVILRALIPIYVRRLFKRRKFDRWAPLPTVANLDR